MTNGKFDYEVKRAEKRVFDMDVLNATQGFGDIDLKSIMFAIEAGIKNPKSGAQFDAYVMVRRLVHQPRN